MVGSLYFGVEKATCFKWLQNVSFKEPGKTKLPKNRVLSRARRPVPGRILNDQVMNRHRSLGRRHLKNCPEHRCLLGWK